MAQDPKELPEQKDLDFPIVGIGASAGGLESFVQLLGFLPPDSGMSFVLVQHLDPTHPSLLTEILSRCTAIPVVEVTDLVEVRPNRIYVMPANKQMTLSKGLFRVEPRRDNHGTPVVIDAFFSSLAKFARQRAIGIILSGTGSDGARGIIEIKAEGGITMAQEIASAKFAEMPQNAIATQCVDFVLAPDRLAQELTRIGKTPALLSSHSEDDTRVGPGAGDPHEILDILQTVHRITGVDFSAYKRATIIRRISRRILLRKKEDLKDYADYLTHDAEEVQALYRDLLIGVTSFFRDPETFEFLKNKIIPEIIKARNPERPVRIWVAGCATGEEVYSLAMTWLDFSERAKTDLPFQIFGTDISESSIEQARRGLYVESSMASIPNEYLKRFFTRADNGYQINKVVRDTCIFARQNVATDPPFSSLDLISCRNVLIYLEPPLQKRVLSLFHYALKPTGFLMLGNSESAGAFANLFSPYEKHQKFYSRRAGVGHPRFDFARRSVEKMTPATPSAFVARDLSFDEDLQIDQDSNKAILTELAPTGAIINEHFEIIRMRGQTGRFLQAPAGPLTNEILKMARPGLRGELAKAIHKASRENSPVKKQNLRLRDHDGFVDTDLEVIPFTSGETKNRYFSVVFLETLHRRTFKKNRPSDDSRLILLEKELTETQEYLQALVDKERSASSDLRVVNEEILSSNEEIQSSNEELETAKEELQSTNEELATVNDELNHRNRSLSELNSDLNNLLGTVHIPVIMLSRDLVIRRFSALAETIINLTPGDIGRNIRDFKPKLNVPDLMEIVANVIENVSEHSQEIQDEKGRWFSLRIRPYQTLEKKIEGAIIALIDIGTLKNMRDYAEAIVRTVRESLIVLDSDLRIKTANPYFYKSFLTSPDETERKLIYEIQDGAFDLPDFRELLRDVLVKDSHFRDFQIRPHTKTETTRTFLLNASRLKDESADGGFILLAIEDATEQTKALAKLTETSDALSRANLELEQFAFVASHDLQEPLRMVSSFMQLLSKKYLGKLDREADEFIGLAVDGAKRMQRLVQDLLGFSQCGKGNLRYETTQVSNVVRATLSNLRTLIEESQSTITFDSLPTIETDPILLGQVFQNLFVNAIKFCGDQRPIINVSARPIGDKWEFSVRDNGIGIEPQYAERIFLIFQRLHTKEQYEGTGIGLAMCKKIVERYGGRIWVESALGAGSTFFFTLPQRARAER